MIQLAKPRLSSTYIILLLFVTLVQPQAYCFEPQGLSLEEDSYSTIKPGAPSDLHENVALDSRQLLTDIRNHEFAAWGVGLATIAVACAVTWEFPCQVFFKILKPNRTNFFQSLKKSSNGVSTTGIANIAQSVKHSSSRKLGVKASSSIDIVQETGTTKNPLFWFEAKFKALRKTARKELILPANQVAKAKHAKKPLIKTITDEAELNYAIARESYLQALDTQVNLDLNKIGKFIAAYAEKSKRKNILDFRRFEAKLPANMIMRRMQAINNQLKELRALMKSQQTQMLTDDKFNRLYNTYSKRRKKLLSEYKALKSWL